MHRHWTACALGWYLIPVKLFDTGASTTVIPCPANTSSQHICPKLPAPKLALCANRMHPEAVGLRQTLPCRRAWIQTSASLAGRLYSHSLPGVAECSIHHQLSSTGRALMALPALGLAVGRVAKRYERTCSRAGGPSSPLPGQDSTVVFATGALRRNRAVLEQFC